MVGFEVGFIGLERKWEIGMSEIEAPPHLVKIRDTPVKLCSTDCPHYSSSQKVRKIIVEMVMYTLLIQ